MPQCGHAICLTYTKHACTAPQAPKLSRAKLVDLCMALSLTKLYTPQRFDSIFGHLQPHLASLTNEEALALVKALAVQVSARAALGVCLRRCCSNAVGTACE